MKKFLSLIVVAMLIMTTACSQPVSEVALRVKEEIERIGTVEASDETLINKADEEYNTLTDSQKEQVPNYIDLLRAKDKLAIIKAQIAAEQEAELAAQKAEQEAAELEAARKEYEAQKREKMKQLNVIGAARALDKLTEENTKAWEDKLKNLVVYKIQSKPNVYFPVWTHNYDYKVIYSAENTSGKKVTYYSCGEDAWNSSSATIEDIDVDLALELFNDKVLAHDIYDEYYDELWND